MTLEEMYALIGGNYHNVLGRMRREALVEKFVVKFLDDPSYNNLVKSLENEDYPEAFRAAHTIKGICSNLSFDKLYESDCELTEALRNNNSKPDDELFEAVKRDYEETISAIKKFSGNE